MAKSMGDSGTFGSRATMDAIYRSQQKKKKVNSNVKAQLTGKLSKLPMYKKGGMVKKTGPAIVHKGELVIPKKKVKKAKKILKKR